MILPRFLIIGAMKAGTTSLYDMLRAVPGLYLPPEKEPGDLLHEAVETPSGRARYARKFAAAPTGSLCGEATTAYAKRPEHEGIASRARRVLGPDLRVIYMVRDPVARALSHHRHLVGLGQEKRPAEIALRTDPSYADFGRYSWQIDPWQTEFGQDQVLILSLERLAADPQGALDRACSFLGVAGAAARATHGNASVGRRATRVGTPAHALMRAPLYQYRLKPLLPAPLHRLGKRVFLRPGPKPLSHISAETETKFRRALCDDPLSRAAGEWARGA
ncbi:MAG: sulfotransferase [Rhodobacteraceae bacterium]|nr:sulfotransferase [Paracoccaceae bacterium]